MSGQVWEALTCSVRVLLRPFVEQRGAQLIAAVSGGVDSVVLLRLLSGLAETEGWRLHVAHFNHQLRGTDSEQDARFVEQLAGKTRLPFHLGSSDVSGFSRTIGVSVEMAARQCRHEFLAALANQLNRAPVLLAHHADDQLELLLLRLARGTSGAGLAGMTSCSPSPADPSIQLIRPLLETDRRSIEAYAKEMGLQWREDPSNRNATIPRNRVRLKVIPELAELNPSSLALCASRAMKVAADESACIRFLASKWLESGDGGFGDLLPAVQRQVVLIQLERLGVDVTFEGIEALRSNRGRPYVFPEGQELSLAENGRIQRKERVATLFCGLEMRVQIEATEGVWDLGGRSVAWRIFETGDPLGALAGRDAGEEWMDFSVVSERRLVLRHWRRGDCFRPLGLAGTRKLQDVWVDRKISEADRHSALLLGTEEGELLWVEGVGISEMSRIRATTLKIFAVRRL